MHKNTLYITFDGLSDPLGQSQILPYLAGLAANGFHIHIISCEKKERLEQEKPAILNILGNLPITWEYIFYNEQGGPASRFMYVHRVRRLALKYHANTKISLVHCRSYLASLVGLTLKIKYNIPFLFDMRGFWADERIEGHIWDRKNTIHSYIYRYFKRKEEQFILNADALVSLTEAAVRDIEKRFPEFDFSKKTTIIPCCTDTQLFNREQVKRLDIEGIFPETHLLVYTGSIGTWYYTRELIDCALAWKELIPEIKLLILTKDNEALQNILASYSTEQKSIIITTGASRLDIPSYLSIAKASVFFIKPSYSKMASSPTKMAECWAMDLPIITNKGIGDNDQFFKNNQGGILINDFSKETYVAACREYLSLQRTVGSYRQIALEHFDTKKAIEKYTTIYNTLSS